MLWENGNRRQDWRESGPMEKVAVIVPFYNSEPYFEQCLNSLVNQDYEKYEIYLIDDRGSDGSLAIAERFQAEYPALIRILRNDVNIGQGRSRIRAVQMTDAAYVMFVDSDDYVSSDYIRRYMAENTDDYDMIVGSFIRDDGNRLDPFSIIDSDYTIMLYSVACCKAYKRSFLLEYGIDFSDSRKGEDIYFSLACYACKARYKVIPYIGYYYRNNPTSTTKSMNYENNFERIVIDMFRRFREKYHPERLQEDMRKKIEYAYIANIVNALVVYNRGCGIPRMREKLSWVIADLKQNYPDFLDNRELRFTRPAGVSRKIRTGVGAFYWCCRLHLTKPLFYAVSLL